MEKIVGVLAIAAFIMITGVAKANPIDSVINWFEAEKQKTIEYQKKSWAKSSDDFSSFVSKFGLKGKDNESQN